ncbi:uncharacterized protein K452DRAFT_238974 [Aplosporella prunicola CBS 121167]|uniref:Uncharacterized protein n=1 Tax=Aplosporella prunicola CBS 121167 TaxID=1176127 RepID=A0A6A6AWL2_9PEZI|nr:uncharacterized protein K452DRAFT_238974 [Aplosporella prunicola CBS 121167]KAF2135648.1 hypothetical protein K452DRAFT_238974 [Aplosporella prunicola CBS 121167]
MLPWAILQRRETAAAETLLLDYVSQNPLKCLYTSYKAKHWAITMVVIVSFLIRMLTVLSTGLFMPQYQNRQHIDIPIMAEDRFEPSALESIPYSHTPALLPVAFLNYKLKFPAGTSDRFAIPTFTSSVSNWDFFTRFEWVLNDAMSTLAGMSLDVLGGDNTLNKIKFNGRSYPLRLDRFFTLYVSLFKVDIKSFLDAPTTYQRAQKLFGLVSVQIAKNNLMVQDKRTQNGTYSTSENWLHVRGLSLYWMLATVSTLLLLTALLMLYTPGRVVSRDPGSIGGLATILARSPSLTNLLSAHGSSTIPILRQVLQNYVTKSCVVHTHAGPEFRIDVIPQEYNFTELENDKTPYWWRPFSISATTKATFIIILALLIMALEVMFQTSEKKQGLASVETTSYVRYTWVHLPGLVMLVIQLLVGMINFTSNVFLPYHELRHWPSRAQSTLLNDQLPRLTVHSLFNSITGGHWAITATSTALLLAPFLTIAASGLYSSEEVLATSNSNVTVDSIFDFHSLPLRTSQQDHGLGFFVSMILQQNLPPQNWTHDEFVYPEISIPSDSIPNSASAAFPNFTTTMPVLRSSLDCSPIPEDNRNVTFGIKNEWVSFVKVRFPVPVGCMDNDETEYEVELFNVEAYPSARMIDLSYNTTSFGCPSILAFYGAEESNLKYVTCTKTTHQLQVKTTFELPSYSILAAEPIEDSAVEIVDGLTVLNLFEAALSYFYQVFLEDSYSYLSVVGASEFVTTILLETARNVNLSIEDIVSAAPNNTAPLEHTMHEIWSVIFVQYANLIAHAVSTRILEGLLAAIALCIAASFWGMNTKEILPKDPCGGIAAAASLVAGAKETLMREEMIPQGAEWLSDKELGKKGVFEGIVFSMGWRNGGENEISGSRRWFGIDLGKSEWI